MEEKERMKKEVVLECFSDQHGKVLVISLGYLSNKCSHVRRWLSHSPSRSIHRLNTYYRRAVTKPSYAFGKSESSSPKIGDNRFLHHCILIWPCAWLCMLSKYNPENIFMTKTGH